MFNYRNPVYTINGWIDCEIDHPEYGWIPFTATPDDSIHYGRELFVKITAAGNITPYQPTPNELIPQFTVQIQSVLDSGARAWGYDNLISAVSYATSSVAQYAADASALTNWRDSVWMWAYAKFPTIVGEQTWEQFSVDMPLQPTQPRT